MASSVYCKFCYKISDLTISDSQEFDPIPQICYCYDYQTYCVMKS